jgi:7,8-didemethyl-8-hydroxy-5-deazariboflavin synthase CofH subunit/7,8-didemethyl-8-hydroxy-5-deazariboflavin synthase CofG subunit
MCVLGLYVSGYMDLVGIMYMFHPELAFVSDARARRDCRRRVDSMRGTSIEGVRAREVRSARFGGVRSVRSARRGGARGAKSERRRCFTRWVTTTTTTTRAAIGGETEDAVGRLLEMSALEASAAALEVMRERSSRSSEASSSTVTFSPKVFVPLTRACRDACGYCAFVEDPTKKDVSSVYMSMDEILAVARAGARAGATECLFTFGDRPEAAHASAREALKALGYESTVEYCVAACETVMRETGLLPHVNAGVLTRDELRMLRAVSASQGLMLETTSERLLEPGQAHAGCETKRPKTRLRVIEIAGEERIPFTSGLLIGIGETREERLDALFELKRLHDAHGHIQELIIQNFLAKIGTAMENYPDPPLEELTWTVAAARLIFGADMAIQAPPNLTPGQESGWRALLHAGANDWGGISPVTPDHVNAEAPWPHISQLAAVCEEEGYTLVPRLPVHPKYLRLDDPSTSVGGASHWLDPNVAPYLRRLADAEFFVRGTSWSPGRPESADDVVVDILSVNGGVPFKRLQGKEQPGQTRRSSRILRAIDAIFRNKYDENDIVACLQARGPDFDQVCKAANQLRKEQCGDVVSFVNNRNINYTNICTLACTFCSFSKGKAAEELRGSPYLLDLEEVERRTAEAWARGASEVCMQGGIHPSFTGNDYLAFIQAAKRGAPDIHIHAFSPLEISHGAETMKMSTREYLNLLKEAGLGSLPGTAAEVLDDEVRKVLCPDKLLAQEWIDVVADAHAVGVPTTSTIMFGHVDSDGPRAWARHLIALRDLHLKTGGFTEFVPLPFVHFEAPTYRSGNSRKGPTLRECILMHAVARLVLGPAGIVNIQASWVKMGPEFASHLLHAGCNDMGGTLMNESITRAAGATFGQEIDARAMQQIITSAGRQPRQRTTLYADASVERINVALAS